MGLTRYRGLPTVDAADAPDGRAQINALAIAVDAQLAALAAGLRAGTRIVMTSSGTFQKGLYAGIKAIDVEVIGAGGGSGSAGATSSTQVSAGAGGAGGAYAFARILAGDLASSEDVQVGIGGGGGTSGSPQGEDGGESYFGGFISAGGGAGGDSGIATYTSGGLSMVRGAPGDPSGSYQIGVRGEGYGGISTMPQSIFGAVAGLLDHTGLHGGRSGGPYGQTLIPPNAITDAVSTAAVVAEAGAGVGSGASGPFNPPSGSDADGAAGADGIVIIQVYI